MFLIAAILIAFFLDYGLLFRVRDRQHVRPFPLLNHCPVAVVVPLNYCGVPALSTVAIGAATSIAAMP